MPIGRHYKLGLFGSSGRTGVEGQEEQLPVRMLAGTGISEDKGATAW